MSIPTSDLKSLNNLTLDSSPGWEINDILEAYLSLQVEPKEAEVMTALLLWKNGKFEQLVSLLVAYLDKFKDDDIRISRLCFKLLEAIHDDKTLILLFKNKKYSECDDISISQIREKYKNEIENKGVELAQEIDSKIILNAWTRRLGAQENHWAGNRGNRYIDRNQPDTDPQIERFWYECLKPIPAGSSLIEFGSSIGINLLPINEIRPDIKLSAVEINEKAVSVIKETLPHIRIFNENIVLFKPEEQWDVTLIKGVLIHVTDDLKYEKVLENIDHISKKFVIICDHIADTPTWVEYEGRGDLWKIRKFPIDFVQRYKHWQIIDTGFFTRNVESKCLDDSMRDVRYYTLKRIE